MHFINCGESNDSSIPAAPLLSTFFCFHLQPQELLCVCTCARANVLVRIDFRCRNGGEYSQSASKRWARAPAGMCGSPEVDHHGGELQLMSP